VTCTRRGGAAHNFADGRPSTETYGVPRYRRAASIDDVDAAGWFRGRRMPVVTISGTSGANAVTITTAGIYSVNLGSGDDTLTVTAPTNITAHGGVGNDSLDISTGTGLVYGDSGVDTIDIDYGGGYSIF